jgi:hypothetical protein
MQGTPAGRVFLAAACLLAAVLVPAAPGAYAESFVLKTGRRVEGRIKYRDPDFVVVSVSGDQDVILFWDDLAEPLRATAPPGGAALPEGAVLPEGVATAAAAPARPASIAEARSPQPEPQPGIVPQGTEGWRSGREGLTEAFRGAPGGVTLYFYGAECSECRAFEENVLASPSVRRYLRNVDKVRIDLAREPELSVRYDVDRAPAFVWAPSPSAAAAPVAPAGDPELFLEACRRSGISDPSGSPERAAPSDERA